MKKQTLSTFILIAYVTVGMRCGKSTEPKQVFGTIEGTVQSAGTALYPAYLVAGDSLLATTTPTGHYSATSIPAGSMALTCSALNYGDTTVQVQVKGDRSETVDFDLTRDETKGLVIGEFQDGYLWAESVKNDPSVKTWTPKEQFDGLTNATMCFKIVQTDLGDRSVVLGDSVIALADAWGQFWFRLPRGVYPLKGTCEGYQNDMRIVRVLPTPPDTVYANFYLPRTAVAKTAR
jgi:hypothetical protein